MTASLFTIVHRSCFAALQCYLSQRVIISRSDDVPQEFLLPSFVGGAEFLHLLIFISLQLCFRASSVCCFRCKGQDSLVSGTPVPVRVFEIEDFSQTSDLKGINWFEAFLCELSGL